MDLNIYINRNLFYTAKEMLEFKRSSMTLGEYTIFKMRNGKVNPTDIDYPYRLLRVCAQATGVSYEEALSRSRKIEAVFARYLSMYLLRSIEIEGKILYSLPAIGVIYFRDHSSVVHGIKEVKKVGNKKWKDGRREWMLRAKVLLKRELGVDVYLPLC